MKSPISTLPVFIIAAFALAFSGCTPAAVQETAAADPLTTWLAAFSEQRAYDEAAAFVRLGPKTPGAPEMETIAAYLHDRLEDAGVQAFIQTFEDATPDGQKTFHNILARIPAAAADAPLLLLAAHYDTKTGITPFEGANDSGSGTGLLIELARTLAAAAPHPVEFRFALFDGEECLRDYGPQDGFHGSRHLAAQMETAGELPRLAAMVLLDMVGDKHLTITIPRNSTPRLVSLAFAAARDEQARDAFRLLDGAIGDDHVPFLLRGVPAIDLIDFQYGSAPGLNDYWHTPEDTLDKLSAESLGTVGRVTLRLLASLAARPFEQPTSY